MLKMLLLFLVLVFAAGCSTTTDDKLSSGKEMIGKKNVKRKLSMKEIDSLSSFLNYSFTVNNLNIDVGNKPDSLK